MDISINQGQVVEFLEGQRFICAQCIGKKGSRYHLLTHLGREMNLASSRFIYVSTQQISSEARERCLQELSEIYGHREALKEEVNIPELWELVRDEQELWSPKELADLAFSQEIGPDHVAALVRAVIEDHTYFKFREGMIKVQSPEAVDRILEQRAREAESLKRIARGSEWLEALWSDGPQREKAIKDLEDPLISFWISAIKDFCINQEDSEYASLVRGLFSQARLTATSAPFDTLIRAGIWHEDENLELARYGIESVFPEAVLQEAESLALSPIDLQREKREDLTDLNTFTIDGPESLDLDDALSIRECAEGWELGVHITDIGLQIGQDSPLFSEAVHRATTIYLPTQKVSMLPEILSHEAWSLKVGEERRALSFFVRLDDRGNILARRIVRSVIRVHERLTYEDAEARIPEGQAFHSLYRLCTVLKAKRIENGALPLPIPELVIQIDGSGNIEISLSQPGPARFLVAECMILANSVAAQFLREQDIPALYRSQPPPREVIISGDEMDLIANFRQRRLISKGSLGTEPEMHHGLGLNAYTTITSPLRRGLDLLMQQQITSVLIHGRPVYTKRDLNRLAIYLQQGLNAAAAVRQARTRYWLLKYIKGLGDRTLDAWILDIGPRRVLAVLSDFLLPIELPIRPGESYYPDQKVKVVVKKVYPRENVLKLDWSD